MQSSPHRVFRSYHSRGCIEIDVEARRAHGNQSILIDEKKVVMIRLFSVMTVANIVTISYEVVR